MKKTKLCTTCNKRKPLSEFHKSKENKDGVQRRCKVCNSKHVKAWQAKNPDHWLTQKARADRIKIQRRMRTYGLTWDEAVALMATTHCPICRKPLEGKGHIDHDHKTGKVRGVLCGQCNLGLGHFKDDITTLQRAIQYLLENQRLTPS